MSTLSDGSVIPSYLTNDFAGPNRTPTGAMYSSSDTSLRVGRVTAAYETSSNGSKGKKILEYDVLVRYADGQSGYTDMLYPRVRMANLFGGTTDFFRWTPRIDNFDPKTQVGTGSRVLVLCVNGNQRMAYIVGGIPNPEDATPVLPFSGHHLEFQFNGVYANIDKEGAFTLIHRGSTNSKNEVKNSKVSNASIRIKDGQIELGYQWDIPKDSAGITENSNELPYFILNRENKTAALFAPGEIFNKTQERFRISTKDGVKVNPDSSDQQAWMRGTTYREKQADMHRSMENAIAQISSYVQQAGTNLNLAGVKGQIASKAMIVPIAGAVASSVPWTLAVLAITEAAMSLTAAKSAIDDLKQDLSTFEQASDQYLSQKHFHAEEE